MNLVLKILTYSQQENALKRSAQVFCGRGCERPLGLGFIELRSIYKCLLRLAPSRSGWQDNGASKRKSPACIAAHQALRNTGNTKRLEPNDSLAGATRRVQACPSRAGTDLLAQEY